VPPITFAHRGGRDEHPENTPAAFRSALARGVRGLETDAWLSADGEVVLRHDEWLWTRVLGIVPWRRRVGRAVAGRLAPHGVATLRGLYEELGADYELSIDLKTPDVGPAIVEVARRHGDPGRLWLCSGSPDALRRLREAYPEIHLVHSQRRSRLSGSVERHAADLRELGIDVMNMPHTDWSAGLVALFHRFDRQVFAWDVQEERHLRAMVRLGVDGVYSDHVERMVSIVP
jgi:glycerophosphoryl diester phosphodiesterase